MFNKIFQAWLLTLLMVVMRSLRPEDLIAFLKISLVRQNWDQNEVS